MCLILFSFFEEIRVIFFIFFGVVLWIFVWVFNNFLSKVFCYFFLYGLGIGFIEILLFIFCLNSWIVF